MSQPAFSPRPSQIFWVVQTALLLSAAFAAAPTPDFTDEYSLEITSETDTTRTVRHALGEVEIPKEPQRIVTLQDQNMLLPLLELGAGEQVAGSVGGADGVFRRTGDFDTSSIAYLGLYGEPNLEAIIALEPDLILGPEGEINAENYPQLSQIAPTVAVVQFVRPLWNALYDVALLTDRQGEMVELKNRYDAQVTELREALRDPAEIDLSRVTPYRGQFYFDAGSFESSTTLLRDLGVTIPELHEEAITQGDYPRYSAEVLPQADGDALFIYNSADGGDDYAVTQLTELPFFGSLNAAQKEQVYIVDGSRTAGIATTGLFYMLGLFEKTLLTEGFDASWEPSGVSDAP